jgi:SAM-dependent methyltransferase
MLDKSFWNSRYLDQNTGWDLGMPSPPLITYVEGQVHRDSRILIPGAGNAWEAEYLYRAGWKNIHVVDLSPKALQNLRSRCPEFPEDQLIEADFFALNESFDLILEQTFFCALDPALRPDYVQRMHKLLKTDGALVGVLFKIPLYDDHPPFGGDIEEYESLFRGRFTFEIWEECRNSVLPRAGNEQFMKLKPIR